jgi:tetratricopeptide (TPR) repeat protein
MAAARAAILEARAARARGDLAGSERVLGEALLADETSGPLLTELALLHRAIGLSGRQTGRMEIARAVAERATAVAPGYAPGHLARGWIAADLKEHAAALASFDRARGLDPRLFEAHLAAAALRLRLRDLAAAEGAYRAALTVRADAYEARVGLARTLRVRIDDGSDAGWEARVEAARSAADQAIAARPDRPEAYLGAAALAMEHESRRDPAASLLRAQKLLEVFLDRARGVPGMERGEQEARLRLAGIDTLMSCPTESERTRKERDLEEKIRAAREEAGAEPGW